MLSRFFLYILAFLALVQVVVPQKGGSRGGGGGSRGGGGGARQAPRPAAQASRGGGGGGNRPAAQAPRPAAQAPRPNNGGGGNTPRPNGGNQPRPGGGGVGNNGGNSPPPRPNSGGGPSRGGSPGGNWGGGGGGGGNLGGNWGGNNGRGGPPPGYNGNHRDPRWASNPNRPGWQPYGNPWDYSGYSGGRPWGDYCYGCLTPYVTATVIGAIPAFPTWAGPGWEVNYPWLAAPPRTVYATYDPVYYGGAPPPWEALPPPQLPPVTLPAAGPLPTAQPNCMWQPVTVPSPVQTQLTYTDTITQPPQDAVITVYLDPDTNSASTDWGPVETVYEVYVYTTTAFVDVVSSTVQC